MSNVTQSQFAATLLQRLGIHQTPGAMKALVGWMAAEGGHWHNDARYNPLNTTQPMDGAGNTGTQGNIKVYRDWQQGVDATAKTLRNGHYGGILAALKSGNSSAVAEAIGKTPWGTNAALVQQAIAGAKTTGHAQALATSGASARAAQAVASRSIPGKTTTDTDAALLDSVMSHSASRGGLLKDVMGRLDSGNYTSTSPSRAVTTSTTATRAANAASGGSSKGLGPLRELFWQGEGGVDVKNGAKVQQGFVSGHTDHVHVASGPKTVVALGQLAQSMGLHVGENPHFGGVSPTAHTKTSYHYRKGGEAIDVSGDPKLMAHYAATVAHKYGLKVKG